MFHNNNCLLLDLISGVLLLEVRAVPTVSQLHPAFCDAAMHEARLFCFSVFSYLSCKLVLLLFDRGSNLTYL